MVFAFLIFTSLFIVTICLIASDPRPASVAAAAAWEIFSGNCGLHCRRNRNIVKSSPVQSLPNTVPIIGQASQTFKQALELTHEHNDFHASTQSSEPANSLEVPRLATTTEALKAPETPESTEAPVSTPTAIPPVPTPTAISTAQEEVLDTEKQVESSCVCETCACDLIENFTSKTKSAEHAYIDFKETVLSSYIYLMLENMYTRMINSYPETIQYLEEDKIDSEENFFFLKSKEGLPNKISAVRKSIDINTASNFNITRSNFQWLTSNASKIMCPPNLPLLSNTPTSPSLSSPPKSSSSSKLSPRKRSCLHHGIAGETPVGLGLTIREAQDPTTEERPVKEEPRRPQSIASLDREIKEFISTGPPVNPPLHTCPSCKSKGLVCIRGCPKENFMKHNNTDHSHE